MKKSIVIVIGIILCLLIIGVAANAQSIDQERMKRDLAIASNVLKSMLNQNGNRVIYMGGNSVEASYLEDYGVIFTLPSNGFMYRTEVASPKVEYFFEPTVPGSDREKIAEKEREIREQEKAVMEQEKAVREQEIELRKQERVVTGQRAAVEAAQNTIVMSGFGSSSEELIESVKSFLVDYTNLIGQLKPSDKIMVKLQSNNQFNFFFQESERRIGKMTQKGPASAEISVADVNSYKSGKMNREAAIGKIKVVESKDVVIEEDVRLFSSILQTVYEANIASSYFMNSRPGIERLTDYGVIYHAQFYSSNPLGFGDDRKHDMPTLGLKNISQDERDKKVKEMLDPFIEGLKANFVEYGRTINSLDNDESVVLKAKLTSCEGCGIPESVELTVKASTLKDYSSGKINKSSAVSKVTEKKIGKQ